MYRTMWGQTDVRRNASTTRYKPATVSRSSPTVTRASCGRADVLDEPTRITSARRTRTLRAASDRAAQSLVRTFVFVPSGLQLLQNYFLTFIPLMFIFRLHNICTFSSMRHKHVLFTLKIAVYCYSRGQFSLIRGKSSRNKSSGCQSSRS